MRFLLLSLIVYLAAAMETSWVDAMRIGHVVPDLLALTAVVWLLTAGGPRAFLTAGGIALVADLIAPGRPGVGMGWMLLVGYVVTRLRTRFKLDHLALQVTTVAIAVTVWAMAVAATGRLLGDVLLPWSTIPARAAGVGLYTAGVGLPVLMVVGWIRRPLLGKNSRLAEFGS